MNLLDRNPVHFNFNQHTTSSLDIITSIHTCIKQLRGQKILQTLNKKFKTMFSNQFPSYIPHAKDLLKDVYHHIKIRPGLPISVRCTYSCPRKYREGWKTLIDQHIAAGHIWPSSSPYTSPFFIIPKADPTMGEWLLEVKQCHYTWPLPPSSNWRHPCWFLQRQNLG